MSTFSYPERTPLSRRVLRFDDEQSLELWRLRYALREAVERGERDATAERALERLRQLACSDESSLLSFELDRWQVQLRGRGLERG